MDVCIRRDASRRYLRAGKEGAEEDIPALISQSFPAHNPSSFEPFAAPAKSMKGLATRLHYYPLRMDGGLGETDATHRLFPVRTTL